jgi:REP element-mobilizing transposase RayT
LQDRIALDYRMGEAFQIRNQEELYFFTFQVVGWADVFSRKNYRDIFLESLEYSQKNKGLEVYAYVIMTNHIHLILGSKSGNLSNTIRDVKRFTSNEILKSIFENKQESRKEWLDLVFKYHGKYNKRVGERQFWTHENHAVELTTNHIKDVKLDYIHQNPVRAGWVEKPENYLYSSAKDYAGEKGLINICYL